MGVERGYGVTGVAGAVLDDDGKLAGSGWWSFGKGDVVPLLCWFGNFAEWVVGASLKLTTGPTN